MSCFLIQLKQFSEVSERQGKAFGIPGLIDSWLAWLFSIFICVKSKFAAAYLELMLDMGNRTLVYCIWMYGRFFQAEHQQHLIHKPDRFCGLVYECGSRPAGYYSHAQVHLLCFIWGLRCGFFFSLNHRWMQCNMLMHSKLSYSYPYVHPHYAVMV